MHIGDTEAGLRVPETVGCCEPFRVDVDIVGRINSQRAHLKDFGGAEDDNFIHMWLPEVVGDLFPAQKRTESDRIAVVPSGSYHATV